jgi:hypothetical protein
LAPQLQQSSGGGLYGRGSAFIAQQFEGEGRLLITAPWAGRMSAHPLPCRPRSYRRRANPPERHDIANQLSSTRKKARSKPIGPWKFWERMPERHTPHADAYVMVQVRTMAMRLRFAQLAFRNSTPAPLTWDGIEVFLDNEDEGWQSTVDPQLCIDPLDAALFKYSRCAGPVSLGRCRKIRGLCGKRLAVLLNARRLQT